MPRLLLAALLAVAITAPLRAQHEHGTHAAHGTADADVPTGLSAAEASGLAEGRGLGMAKPAEMNGYPGPLHVLDLADSLALSDRQRVEAERLRAEMLAAAIPLGEQLLMVERHLDALFASGEATPEAVDRMTGHAADLRGRLRAVHLQAHLGMRDALTAEQIARYHRLRGHAH